MAAGNRGGRRGILTAPLLLLIIFAVVSFTIGVFFRVSTIEVRGAVIYTDEEIIEAAGIDIGDNLFFINRFKAAGNVYARLPYISTASVDRSMPNKVIITVTESRVAARVFDGESWWSVDAGLKVLNDLGPAAEDFAEVTGIEAVNPAVGEELVTASGQAAAAAYLQEILEQADLRDMLSHVQYIDMTDPYSPLMGYDGRFTIRMLEQGDTGYKLDLVLSAVEQLASGDSGTLEPDAEAGQVHYWPN